jgi:hypothetical protein
VAIKRKSLIKSKNLRKIYMKRARKGYSAGARSTKFGKFEIGEYKTALLRWRRRRGK